MHIKTASTDYPINDLLRNRWSPRAYSPQPVETEKIKNFLEAARWSPSASNQQPWRFIIGFKGDETYNKLVDSMVEFNRLWAVTAPVLLLAIAKTTNHKGEPNTAAVYDLGQSVAHLTFQATADGLYVHQMGGFDAAKTIEAFEIPGEYRVMTIIAVGTIGDPELLHENLRKMEITPRERIKIQDLVFSGSFGKPSEVFNKQTNKQ